MQEVIDLRNASQHEYWILEPETVHAAVQNQRQHLPAFIAAVGEWVEGLLGSVESGEGATGRANQ
jgi:uncharacterized protein YutE (UPF0331/DUF86 family)